MEHMKLTIGAFQFSACESIESNLKALKRGIQRAKDESVRLLLTQECALCGYPPVEVGSINLIDRNRQLEAYEEISLLAHSSNMYIALGMVTFIDDSSHNSIQMINPDGERSKPYHKRALWGWDRDNFHPGKELGIYNIDGINIGARICFEVRFPEYFRELFDERVDLALVAFSDVGKNEQKSETIQAHLISRATENAMFVLSANSVSQNQLAPTCLIDPDGNVLSKAPSNQEYLLAAEIEINKPGFGREGIITHARALSASRH